METVKVVLADDHQIIRDGVKTLLSDVDDIEVVDEAENGDELIKKLKDQTADLVILDINMPLMNGIQAAEFIKEKYPKIKILVLSMYDEEAYVVKVLQVGVSGYILKNTEKKDLLEAIYKVMNGEQYFSSEITMKMVQKISKNAENTHANLSANHEISRDVQLTNREKEILKLIADGNTNKNIAFKLNISPRTVDTHRRNLLQKLGVKNTAGLVKYAIQIGLI